MGNMAVTLAELLKRRGFVYLRRRGDPRDPLIRQVSQQTITEAKAYVSRAQILYNLRIDAKPPFFHVLQLAFPKVCQY